MDCYHPDKAMVFQFHSFLFHGNDCHKFDYAWHSVSAQARCECTEYNEEYLRDSCSYMLVTIWDCEWERLKHINPVAAEAAGKADPLKDPWAWLLDWCQLPVPSHNLQSVLQARHNDQVFGKPQVNIHMPEGMTHCM